MMNKLASLMVGDASSGVHKHTCYRCNETWDHTDRCGELPTEVLHIAAHSCPKCQRQQYLKELTGKPVTIQHPSNQEINRVLSQR